MNKKIISILICLLLLSQSCFALTNFELAERLNTVCPDFVKKLYDGGVTLENIANFIEDTETELDKRGVYLTEANFNTTMKAALSKALKYKRNLPLYTAFATQYSSEAMSYTLNGRIPQSLTPLYDFFRNYYLYEREKFSDMNDFLWANEAVTYLSSIGMLSGYPDKTFGGNTNITRAEFTKLLTFAFNISSRDGETAFNDISPDMWFSSYINAANEAGIISGYPDGSFRPNDGICRQDMAVMIYRAAAYDTAGNALSYNDAYEISPYAVPAVQTLVSRGIIHGTGENIFAPLAPATRAQAAQIIYNIIRG